MKMNDEKIIRDEAIYFSNRYISLEGRLHAIEQFKKLKLRLDDFYAPEAKALFLNEVQRKVIAMLNEHVGQKHDGVISDECQYDNKAEKLLFYIRQEVDVLPLVAEQKKPSLPDQTRDKVFVSYSHNDKEYLESIKKHFKPFLKHIDFWDDTQIKPGQVWKDEIKKAIQQTKIAILLVSADFLASDFITNNELPALLNAAEEEGAVILTVVLKPCLFEEVEHLNQFQTMNPPSYPLIKMDDMEREELYVNLVRQTKRILKEK